MEIKTYLGRKLYYIDGIYRRQIELDRHLRNKEDLKLTYEYYINPRNALDFFTKRYILYPFRSYKRSRDDLGREIVNNITFQYLGDLALFLDKNRTVITCHDVFGFLEKKNIRNPYITKKYSLLGLRKCKYIISISEFTKNELTKKLKIPNEKIFVIKNGMNQEMFKPISNKLRNEIEPFFPDHKKLIHVGTEESRKNFLTLLKAFYFVKKKIPNIKLIRVGESSYNHIIRNLGLENDIIYMKNISNKRLNELYNLSDFLIFPSIYEGWGAPGLEAAASGTPVICSDIPIFKEIYKDFPIYFSPMDYKDLANIIINNIDNIALKQEISKKELNEVASYSWKKSSEKYLKLVNYVIENS